jgi:hypothetical protein
MLGNINKISIIKIISDALWTLSGLSEHSKPNVDRIDQEDIMPLLIKYAVHENGNLYFPSIRILGNFS